ncbi:hypothetical protein [Kribbella italica]|uniref:Uncharacterized protein n=1 Tax=Kribbella italica TaxID=1540520 RepID=A0A7W9JA99_9ACTN|nr:hypothetical protein [Kribbella italica]MBB5838030.1 hypothetical protein [Kribbella italica]
MNTDELRTLLKEAGRPVDSPGDPVAVIRKRGRRRQRTQVAAAVACTAVVAAGAFGAVDLWSSDDAAPAGPVAADTPPGALGETPTEVGDRHLLDRPRVHREPEATPRGLYLGLDGLRADDLVRIRTICPTASGPDPVMLEVSLEPSNGQAGPPPGAPVPGARSVACVGAITFTDFVVPAGWPRYSVAQVDVQLPESRGMKLEVAAYR